jgi:hypothetical protein
MTSGAEIAFISGDSSAPAARQIAETILGEV